MFKGKAVGGPSLQLDREVARRALSLLCQDDCVELRALPAGRSFVAPAGNLDELLDAAAGFLADGLVVYFCLNPISDIGQRAANKADVLRRRWLLIDVDPTRAKGHDKEGATDDEKEHARTVAIAIRDWLDRAGWPAPLLIDSGNGFHLLYRVDLPNTQEAHSLLKVVTHALADRFDTPAATVDRKVHNAARISKLPGGWSMKGGNTDDRPWRPVLLLHAPETVGVVSEAMLSEAVKAAQSKAGILKGKAAASDQSGYYKAALDREIGRLMLAAPGDRNNQLNASAFSLGQLVAGGGLIAEDVAAALQRAAIAVGLDEGEIEPTINSGMEAGKKEPRRAPEPTKDIKAARAVEAREQAKGAGKLDKLTIKASRIERKRVEWFWHNRIPKRFITLFCGRTAVGKSFVLCDLISRLSVGGEIPLSNGECFEAGSSLLISEDPYEYMIVPRLIEMGADLDKVHFMSLDAMVHYTLDNEEWLDRAYEEAGQPKLIAIDPPTNFLGDVDEHRNAEIRQLLMHLVKWTQTRDCVFILILHVNKQSGKGVEALSRVLGSVAWTTVSRVAHSFCIDPDDPKQSLFVPMKNNLGPVAKGLTFSVVSSGEDCARVEWKGEVETTADEGMSGEKGVPRKRRGVAAAEWLEQLFADAEQLPSKEIFQRKRSETDISDDGLREGKDQLGITARQDVDPDGVRQWFWLWLPDARRRWALKKQQARPVRREDEMAF